MKHATIAILVLFLLSVSFPHAATFAWKSKPTEASSQELVALDGAIHAAHTSLTAYPVSDLVWEEEDFSLIMKSGTLYLEPTIDGTIPGSDPSLH